MFKYLRGTTDYGIIFSRQQSVLSIVGYVDADTIRDLDDRRSTMGYVFTLGKGPICWKSMIQSLVALSITELEYMEVDGSAKEALWLAGLVNELGMQQSEV